MREDDRAIGIENVLLGALEIVLGGHLLEVVVFWKRTDFSQSSLGNPSSMRDIHCNRSIKSSLVGSGLSAAYDFG